MWLLHQILGTYYPVSHTKLESEQDESPGMGIWRVFSEPVGLDSLPLCQQVSNFRRQDQGTSIVASVEIGNYHGRVLRHILVDEMTSLREDVQGVFACK